MSEYYLIFAFFLFSFILSIILFSLSYFLVTKKYDNEKISAYECGFSPFEDSRNRFNVHFYLVSILFIIFDLEITFLFPWSISLLNLNLFGYFTMLVFLLVLTIGFLYEWKKGALEW
jgi:NADH:ubiquinone oxidoreductase subunit 3 (subunit A)